MVNNVYIGNRYVPKFYTNSDGTAQWNQNAEYEPLIIVTNEGSSYTSRKPVPSGIALTNSEYWVLSGNYNAQVEQYRQEINNAVQGVEDRLNGQEQDFQLILAEKQREINAYVDETKTDVTEYADSTIEDLNNTKDEILGILNNTDYLIDGGDFGQTATNIIDGGDF